MTHDGDGTRRRHGCGRTKDVGSDARVAEQALAKAAALAAEQVRRILTHGGVGHIPAPEVGRGSGTPRRARGWAMGRRGAAGGRDTPAAGYDELGMVAHTIVRFHPHLLTAFERRALDGFEARWQIALSPDPHLMQRTLEATGALDGHGLGAVMARGYEDFCREIAERVLREQPDLLVLNRCPRCARIVRTPRARQCLWCFHDWH